MPFVYSEEDQEWPEDAGDDYEPAPPLPEQFEYLAPPDFGGAREPVKFSDSAEAKVASTGPKRPLKERIFLWLLGKTLPGAGDFMAQRKQQQQDAARRRQQLFAVMIPALRQIGGRRVRCVYDGGNDEGPPGVRGEEGPGAFYGAYFRDLEGNKLCAFRIGPAD